MIQRENDRLFHLLKRPKFPHPKTLFFSWLSHLLKKKERKKNNIKWNDFARSCVCVCDWFIHQVGEDPLADRCQDSLEMSSQYFLLLSPSIFLAIIFIYGRRLYLECLFFISLFLFVWFLIYFRSFWYSPIVFRPYWLWLLVSLIYTLCWWWRRWKFVTFTGPHARTPYLPFFVGFLISFSSPLVRYYLLFRFLFRIKKRDILLFPFCDCKEIYVGAFFFCRRLPGSVRLFPPPPFFFLPFSHFLDVIWPLPKYFWFTACSERLSAGRASFCIPFFAIFFSFLFRLFFLIIYYYKKRRKKKQRTKASLNQIRFSIDEISFSFLIIIIFFFLLYLCVCVLNVGWKIHLPWEEIGKREIK